MWSLLQSCVPKWPNTEQLKGIKLLEHIQILVSAVHKIPFKNLVTNAGPQLN